MAETICDRCGRAIDEDDASEGIGEWEGATLCPDCASEVHLEHQRKQGI